MYKGTKVYLYKDNKIEREFNSVHEASKEIEVSRATILNYCNNKIQKRKYDLRWR